MTLSRDIEILLAVGEATAAQHTESGWYCNACDTDCGWKRRDLCGCCSALADQYETEGRTE